MAWAINIESVEAKACFKRSHQVGTISTTRDDLAITTFRWSLAGSVYDIKGQLTVETMPNHVSISFLDLAKVIINISNLESSRRATHAINYTPNPILS